MFRYRLASRQTRWTPAWYSGDPSTENPDAMFPRLTYGKNENNTQVSTFWKGNSKYLRLQEISLTYNLKLFRLVEQCRNFLCRPSIGRL